MRLLGNLPLIALVALTACVSVAEAPAAGQRTGSSDSASPKEERTLRMVTRAEPASIAGTILIPTGITTGTQRRLFNAGLVLKDGDGKYRPYLAETAPQLNTDSWRVLPDGRMETTYRLRPGLVWQDGTPLSAQDFAFAWRVYSSPQFGVSRSLPHSAMQDIVVNDDRTLVIRWRDIYFEAGNLESTDFAPLPRHVLEAPFAQDVTTFDSLPFWTTEYVGAGPYRLDRWEPGAFIEARAFTQHVLGAPNIDRLRITWNSDFNANLASLLATEADLPIDDSIRVEQGLTLDRDWTTRGAGSVRYRPQLPRFIQVQHRAEYADPPAVRDVRVRQALTHAIDKASINETLFEGKGLTSDSLIYPTVDYFAAVDRAAAKYPFDLRRSDQLLSEAGFSRDTEGSYTDARAARVNLELRNIQSAQNDAERSIIADGWRRAGFQLTEDVFTPSQTRNGELLGTFRSLSITSAAADTTGLNVEDYTCARASRPETRWFGQNRGGWCNTDYDYVMGRLTLALDPKERGELVAEAIGALTSDLGIIPLHFNPGVVAVPAQLQGPNVKVPDADLSWNVHEWRLSQ